MFAYKLKQVEDKVVGTLYWATNKRSFFIMKTEPCDSVEQAMRLLSKQLKDEVKTLEDNTEFLIEAADSEGDDPRKKQGDWLKARAMVSSLIGDMSHNNGGK